MQMLIKLNMSPRNAFLHALCIYHIPYIPYTILMLATTANQKRNQQSDWVRVKLGKMARRRGNGKPQFMLLCRTSKCFSIISDSFRHLSPAAGSGSSRFSARWTTTTRRRHRNYKWSQGQVEWVEASRAGERQSEQYYLQNKRVLTSSLEQFVKSPPQLQPFDWAETCGIVNG